MQETPEPCDAARLSRIVRHESARVARQLRRFGVRPGDIDDAAQRVFLTAARTLDRVRNGAERAYVLAVALREAGHVRRSYRRRGEIAHDQLDQATTESHRPDELAARRQALASAHTALSEMCAELRTVFVLFEIEELTLLEISRRLDIPLGTVKSRLRRARQEFAATLLGATRRATCCPPL